MYHCVILTSAEEVSLQCWVLCKYAMQICEEIRNVMLQTPQNTALPTMMIDPFTPRQNTPSAFCCLLPCLLVDYCHVTEGTLSKDEAIGHSSLQLDCNGSFEQGQFDVRATSLGTNAVIKMQSLLREITVTCFCIQASWQRCPSSGSQGAWTLHLVIVQYYFSSGMWGAWSSMAQRTTCKPGVPAGSCPCWAAILPRAAPQPVQDH